MTELPREVTLEYYKDWWRRHVDKPIPEAVTDEVLQKVLDLGNAKANRQHIEREKNRLIHQDRTKQIKKEEPDEREDQTTSTESSGETNTRGC